MSHFIYLPHSHSFILSPCITFCYDCAFITIAIRAQQHYPTVSHFIECYYKCYIVILWATIYILLFQARFRFPVCWTSLILSSSSPGQCISSSLNTIIHRSSAFTSLIRSILSLPIWLCKVRRLGGHSMRKKILTQYTGRAETQLK